MPRRPKIPHPTGKFNGRLRSAAHHVDPHPVVVHIVVPQVVEHQAVPNIPSQTTVNFEDDQSNSVSRDSINNMSTNMVRDESERALSDSSDTVMSMENCERRHSSSPGGDDGEMRTRTYFKSARTQFGEGRKIFQNFGHSQLPNNAIEQSVEMSARVNQAYMPSETIPDKQNQSYPVPSDADSSSSTIPDGMDYQLTPQPFESDFPSSTVPDEQISYPDWFSGSAWEHRVTPTTIWSQNRTSFNLQQNAAGGAQAPSTPRTMSRNTTVPCSAPSSSGSRMRVNRSSSPGTPDHRALQPQWVAATPAGRFRQVVNQAPIRRQVRARIPRSGSVRHNTGVGEAWLTSQVYDTQTTFSSRFSLEVPATANGSPIKNGNRLRDSSIVFETQSQSRVCGIPLGPRSRFLAPTQDPGSSVRNILAARYVRQENQGTNGQVRIQGNHQVQDGRHSFMNDNSSETESWVSETTITGESPRRGGENRLTAEALQLVMGNASPSNNGSSRASFNPELDERIGWIVMSRTPTPYPVARDITPRPYTS